MRRFIIPRDCPSPLANHCIGRGCCNVRGCWPLRCQFCGRFMSLAQVINKLTGVERSSRRCKGD